MSDIKIIVDWKTVASDCPEGSIKETCADAIQSFCSSPCEVQLQINKGLCYATVSCRVEFNVDKLKRDLATAVLESDAIQAFESVFLSQQAYQKIKADYYQQFPKRGRSASPVRSAEKSKTPKQSAAGSEDDKRGRPSRRYTRSMARKNKPVILDDDNSNLDVSASASYSKKEEEDERGIDRRSERIAVDGSQFNKYRGDFMCFATNDDWIQNEAVYIQTWKANQFLQRAFDLMLQVWQRGQQGANTTHTRETLWDWVLRQYRATTYHHIKRIRPVQRGICSACQSTRNVSLRLIPDFEHPSVDNETYGSCCGAGMKTVFTHLGGVGDMIEEQRSGVKDLQKWWLDFTLSMDAMQTFLVSI